MRVELPRIDAGGFQRLARALAGRVGPDPFPGLILRAGAGGLAAMALRVEAGRALALEGRALVPALHPGCLRAVVGLAADAARSDDGALWLVRRADGGAEAMDDGSFGHFLADVRETGDEVALGTTDRAAAEGAWRGAAPLALAS